MDLKIKSRISKILQKYEQDLLKDWIKEQLNAITLRADLISEVDLRRESSKFLKLLCQITKSGILTDINAPEWQEMLEMLAGISNSRAEQGFTISETVTFIFSLKQPLFSRLSNEIGNDAEALKTEVWATTILLDKLGLYCSEVFQKSREDVIIRQQKELLELSTPVVKLWEGILTMPLIGTLDSERTQMVMENLLTTIAETSSPIAIIDITGVPMIDTMVAQHLLKTVAAARLMGAECFISGIRPQIAQTIVHLGVNLDAVITKASLADAFTMALDKIGVTFTKSQPHL